MIPNEIVNETAKQNTNVININTSNNQTATRSINSSQSNRLDRKNRFNLPGDQAYQQSSLLSNSQSNKIQIQSTKNNKSTQDSNLNANKEKQNQENNMHIKEEVVNEVSSICNSVQSKKQYQTNQNNNQDASPHKARILYGSQIIQVRQSQQQIVEQMNSSMQSFHSKKSKDLQVYSAQDNKMLTLEVKNPENIEKLKLKIEQDEQKKLNSGIENKSQINVYDNNKEKQRQKDDKSNIQKETNNTLSCKICLEEGDSEKQGKIFTPCQCTGTCKWIHEECLKEWIISRYVHLQTSNNPRDFLKAECEICKYRYNMKFETQQKFYRSSIYTKDGKKSFITCICSMLCIVAYIFCILFFLVINNKGSGTTSNSINQSNDNSNQNNQGSGHQSSSSSGSNVQSYEYALIIVCSLLILLSLIVCIVSTRQAFFRRSISKWVIFKYDPILNQVQNNNQNKKQQQKFNNQSQNYQSGDPPNNDRNLRFYYNGQVFNTNLRNSLPINEQRYHVTRQINPNRNISMRREPSTQDQSQLFNLRNSELAARQNQQNLILIQDQTVLQSNHLNVENDDAMSQNMSARQAQNNDIVRVDNNRYNINIDDESFEYFNNSQDMVVYQFNNNNNNQRSSNFNLADNY
ncbi:hypothetical protein ABPG72_015058 [Tetrahymena utriculariae]